MENEVTNVTFESIGVPKVLADILTKKSITTPSPIQAQAIPVAREGADVMGIAQTGTGKTLAFGLPMIENLAKTKKRGLIILPTRELAAQVDENLKMIGAGLGMRTALLIGGASMYHQKQQLMKRPHVIIATPGRLNDFLEQRAIRLDDIGVLVLDEADRMLDMGFQPQIERILKSVPRERQTMLFSATMPAEIVHIATSYMRTPVRIEVAPAGTSAERVAQEIIFVHKDEKLKLLENVLKENEGSVLVFSRTKHGARKIARAISDMGHTAGELHANLSFPQRKRSLENFKSGKSRVLVATDIAARGVDVAGLSLVVNYDLPDNPDDYVHRIGRTGRAGREGRAVSFVTPDQRRDVRDIERIIRKSIPVAAPVAGLTPVAVHDAPGGAPSRSRGGNRRPYGGQQRRGGFRQRGPKRYDV